MRAATIRACAAACRSTRLRAPPTPLRRLAALQLAQQPPPRLQQRACSSVSGAGNGSEGELHRAEPPKPAADSAAAALVTLPSDRRRVAEWLQEYFGWRLLTPKVAEVMPQDAVDKFDEFQAEKVCDVFKVRYAFRDRDVEQLVSDHPAVLGYSLKHQIIPAINILEKDLMLGNADHPELLMRRLILRVPQMLANDLSGGDLRYDFAFHAKRVLHLSNAETDNLMRRVPKAGKPLQRPHMW